jgi:hypothetical protein
MKISRPPLKHALDGALVHKEADRFRHLREVQPLPSRRAALEGVSVPCLNSKYMPLCHFQRRAIPIRPGSHSLLRFGLHLVEEMFSLALTVV